MKKILYTFLLIVTHTLIFGQEQITNVISKSSNLRMILKEVNNKQYAITIDKLDSVKVYQIIGEKLHFLYSRYYSSIYSEYQLKYTDTHLLIENAKGSVAYNFITNEEYWTYYTGDRNYTRWYGANNDYVFLTQSTQDFKDGINYLVDLKNHSKELLNYSDYFWGLENNEKNYLIRDFDSLLNNEIYLITNRENHHTDTMAVGNLNGNYYFCDSTFLYELDMNVFEYHFYTKQTRKICQVKTKYDVTITDRPTEYIISNTDRDYTYIQTIEKNNLTIIHDSFVGDYNRPWEKVIQNKILFFDRDSVMTYDVNTKAKQAFYCIARSMSSCTVIKDRYLIYRDNFNLFALDLQDMKLETLMDSTIYNYVFRRVENIEYNGKYLTYFEGLSESPYSLIAIDIDNKTANISSVLTNNSGLVEGSKVVKLGQSVVLLANNDVYHVLDNKAIKLNKLPILKTIHETYKIDDNRLMWLESDGSKIYAYTFEDDIKTLRTTFSSVTNTPPFTINVYDYLVTNQLTYVRSFGLDEVIYQIENATGVKTIIGDADLGSIDNFATSHGNVYYFSNDRLNVVLASGDLKILDFPLPEFGLQFIYKFKGEVYLFGKDGFYRMVDQKYELIMAIDESDIGISSFYDFGKYAILSPNLDQFLFDGQQIIPMTINFQNGTLLSDDILALVQGVATNTTYTELYNIHTQQIIPLPADIAKMRLSSIFTNFNTQYLVAKSGFHPYYNVHIFKCNADYTSFNEVKKFESSGWSTNVHFNAFNNEGLLYTGSKIFLMNDTIGFEYLSSIGGDDDAVGSVEKDGFFYFLGIHPTEGRQLFRTLVISLRVETEEVTQSQSIKISPNPASDRITLGWGASVNKNYSIISADGNVIQKGKLESDTIQISSLTNGIYILQISDENGKTIGVAKFVRM